MVAIGDPIPCHEAELVEVDDSDTESKAWNRKTPKETKERFLGELMGYAQMKGYKQGWSMHQYRQRAGVWPNKIEASPKPPTELVRNWIKSQAIARRAA